MGAPGPTTPAPPRVLLASDPRALEERLLQELAAAPPPDPFAPTWIVAPTRRLLDHLAFTLATKRGALAGVHFLHHQSLAAHVLEQAGAAPLAPASDALLEALLVERLAPARLALAAYLAAQPAAIGALRATLRDLRDAGVDAAAAGRAHLSERGKEVVALLAEHEAIVAALERDGATDGAGVARAATRALHAAKDRAARPARLIHYGAYELIGIHRELVTSLARGGVASIYVAAAGESERPGELAAAFGARVEAIATAPPSRAQSLVSTAGPREEMRLAARTLLRWHEDGVPFEETALLARGGAGHARALQAEAALLECAPDTSFARPLAELPDALALRQIVELATDPASPLLLDRVERVAQAGGRALARDFARGDAAARVAALSSWARDRGNAALVAELAEAEREIARHPVLAAVLDGRGPGGGAALARYVLQRLDARRLAPEKVGRLRVLELHQARALPFRRAVLIGANDRLLPHRASEDYFLSDDDRRKLRDATGAPLALRGETRRDDELLFDTVCAAVREELVVSFARADADDRDASPSPFLRRIGLAPSKATPLVPRSPLLEVAALRERTGLLAPAEALAAEVARADAGDARAAVRALGFDGELAAAGLARIAAIDSYRPGDLRFDGGGVAVAERPGWSPSGLEQLGTCPLQFFFQRELGVKRPAEGYAGEIDGAALGNLLHGALCRLYTELLPEGAPILAADALPRARERMQACLEAEAAAMPGFPSLAPRFRRLRMEQLARDLSAFVEEDLTRCEALGLRAVAFESVDEIEVAAGKRRLALSLRLDRLLADAGGDEWIGDYKTSGATKLQETASVRWMARGKSLQLPLYRLARRARGRRVGGLELLALRPPRRPDDERFVAVDVDALASADAEVADTLDALVELRDSGHFPLWSPPNSPFVRCSHCEFRRACRHAHAPTRARVEAAPEHARFFALADKTIARKSKGGGGPA